MTRNQLDFEELLSENYHNLVNTLHKYTKDWDDAQDCAQQAASNAWLKFHTFRGDCKFSTWLTRIGINVVYKSMDKQKRRPPREDILVDSMDEHLYSDVFDFDTPELLSSLNQSQVIVAEAVDNMPTEQAEALTLREQDGLTYKQIADIMGSPVGTVQSRISRAKEHIRKHLEEAENESR